VPYSSEIEKLEKRFNENPKGRNFAPLADAYRKAGEVDKAIELCVNGLKHHPDYISAHIVHGRCLIDQKNDAGAEEVFRRILTLDPENIIALKVLAELAERTGRYGEQVEWLARLLAADPMNDEARNALRDAKAKVSAAPEPEPEPAPNEPGLIDLDANIADAPTTAMPLVEHEEVELKSGGPRASGIETFDDLSFNTPPADSPSGLMIEEPEPIEPEPVSVEGLARTAYDGSGMFRLDAPDDPDDEPAVEATPEPAVEASSDLPLIMPDEQPRPRLTPPPPPAPPRSHRPSGDVPAAVAMSDDDGAADAATLSAAEPVLTETMADLYLQQGHREDALRVYRALLSDRPGDARLAQRIRDLEAPTIAEEPVAPRRRATPAPRAARAPQESAAAFLRRVWRGEAAPARPADNGPLDAVFGGPVEAPDLAAAPTQPAQDVISLDSVFGDQVGRGTAADLPPPAPPASAEAAPRADSGGFSFDDFFGAAPNAAAANAPRGRTSRPQPQPEDEDLDQFQAWLKGLKA
jgi:tetratricopeptide (TPR) repeat protein